MTDEMKYTSGPWVLSYVERGAFQIADEFGETVICHRNFWDSNADKSNENGRLIRAAPEMLAALKKAYDKIDEVIGGPDPDMAIANLIDIIDSRHYRSSGEDADCTS